jgi:multidrug efflux pump subunit AcrA (membrane-fusion protein)
MRVVAGFSTLAVVACVVILLMHKDPPQKAAAEVPGDGMSRSDAPASPAVIRSRGIVTPKVRVEIMPEVAGKVVYVHSRLRAGGLIRANEQIARIDPSGYELAVRRARAVVDEAQAKLDFELVARGMRQPQGRLVDVEGQVDLPAVLYEPLVRQAEAALESAKAELAMAELQLSRTSIVLPFDVLIDGPTVSLGQYVGVGRSLAVAYGTDAFEIVAPVRDEDWGRLGDGAGPAQTSAEIKAVLAGREYVWPGRVLGTTNRVDSESGMTSIVVEAPRPMETSADRPALLPGMAVEVCVDGERTDGALDDAENVGKQ